MLTHPRGTQSAAVVGCHCPHCQRTPRHQPCLLPSLYSYPKPPSFHLHQANPLVPLCHVSVLILPKTVALGDVAWSATSDVLIHISGVCIHKSSHCSPGLQPKQTLVFAPGTQSFGNTIMLSQTWVQVRSWLLSAWVVRMSGCQDVFDLSPLACPSPMSHGAKTSLIGKKN